MSDGTEAARLIIIGGGFTGAVLAINAIRQARQPLEIIVVEPRAEIGRGTAYSTVDPAHRINVPTERMPIFADDPAGATRWFFEHGILPDPAATDPEENFYVAREAYGAFIVDRLRCTLQAGGGLATLRHFRAAAIGITQDGGGWSVTLSDETVVTAGVVALCFGHAAPALPCPVGESAKKCAKFIADPWAPNALSAIEPGDSVLIAGTGLTMADAVCSLMARGHQGTLTAISRRGLLPRQHGLFRSDIDVLKGRPAPHTALELLSLIRRRIREQVSGIGWHPVIDSLRAQLPLIWNSLPVGEKRRVLKRLLPFWEVHRFRISPQAGDAITQAMQSDQIAVEKAGLASLERKDGKFHATIRTAGSSDETRLFDAVILCTGPDKNLRTNALIKTMLDAGLAKIDDTGFGLAVDQNSRVIDSLDRPWQNFLAFGPMTRSSFGEMTGAPDIARHIERIAPEILASLAPPGDIS